MRERFQQQNRVVQRNASLRGRKHAEQELQVQLAEFRLILEEPHVQLLHHRFWQIYREHDLLHSRRRQVQEQRTLVLLNERHLRYRLFALVVVDRLRAEHTLIVEMT